MLDTRDLRLTPQRQAVLDVLRGSADHPTAAEVVERVQQHRPGTGAATVYRTLALLVACGEALELSLGDGAARYDANVTRHDHLVCDDCGRAVDVDAPIPRSAVSTVSRATGYVITGYDLQFRGRCPDCTTPAPHRGGPRWPR